MQMSYPRETVTTVTGGPESPNRDSVAVVPQPEAIALSKVSLSIDQDGETYQNTDINSVKQSTSESSSPATDPSRGSSPSRARRRERGQQSNLKYRLIGADAAMPSEARHAHPLGTKRSSRKKRVHGPTEPPPQSAGTPAAPVATQ